MIPNAPSKSGNDAARLVVNALRAILLKEKLQFVERVADVGVRVVQKRSRGAFERAVESVGAGKIPEGSPRVVDGVEQPLKRREEIGRAIGKIDSVEFVVKVVVSATNAVERFRVFRSGRPTVGGFVRIVPSGADGHVLNEAAATGERRADASEQEDAKRAAKGNDGTFRRRLRLRGGANLRLSRLSVVGIFVSHDDFLFLVGKNKDEQRRPLKPAWRTERRVGTLKVSLVCFTKQIEQIGEKGEEDAFPLCFGLFPL